MAGKNVRNVSELSDNKDPRLDFYSEQFDPLLALRTPGIVPPVETARTHDNIFRFNSAIEVMKRGNETRAKKKDEKPQVKQENVIQRRWLPHQLPVKSERVRVVKNVYTRMLGSEGPLAVLRKCMDKKLKIKVVTRHSHGIRGYCTGDLVLYDKHWNLALENVEETWTRKKRRKIPALDSAKTDDRIKPSILPPPIKIVESTPTTETCYRYVKQLMLRGEHVVFIVILSQEQVKIEKEEL